MFAWHYEIAQLSPQYHRACNVLNLGQYLKLPQKHLTSDPKLLDLRRKFGNIISIFQIRITLTLLL